MEILTEKTCYFKLTEKKWPFIESRRMTNICPLGEDDATYFKWRLLICPRINRVQERNKKKELLRFFSSFFFECQKFVLKKNIDTLSVTPGKYVEALI